MGIIISNDFIAVANAEITARSEASGYPKINVMDNWHLKRRFRADDLVKSDANPLMVFDLGEATTVAGILLNDVNFDKTRIRGHATHLGTDWSGSTFDSGSDHAVSKDERVNRYKIYLPPTGFNYRYLAIMTPAAASAVGSYQTKWEIGTVVILGTVTEFSRNMSYGYERSAKQAYEETGQKSGGIERVSLGEIKWTGQAVFNVRTKADEADLWTINNYNIADPLIFYENDGEDDKAYLCVRDDDYSGTLIYKDIVKGNSIRFQELV